jgi:hypothetical protein
LSVTRTAKICPIEIAANISPCVTGKIAQLHVRPYSPKLQSCLPRRFRLGPPRFGSSRKGSPSSSTEFPLGLLSRFAFRLSDLRRQSCRHNESIMDDYHEQVESMACVMDKCVHRTPQCSSHHETTRLPSSRSFPRPHIFDAERGGEVRIIRHSKPLRHCFAVENQK